MAILNTRKMSSLQTSFVKPWLSLPRTVAIYVSLAFAGTLITSAIVAPIINDDARKSTAITPTIKEEPTKLPPIPPKVDTNSVISDSSSDVPMVALEFDAHPSYYFAANTSPIRWTWEYKKRGLLQQGWSLKDGKDACRFEDECQTSWISAQGNPYTLIIHQKQGYVSEIEFVCQEACNPSELQNVFGPIKAAD